MDFANKIEYKIIAMLFVHILKDYLYFCAGNKVEMGKQIIFTIYKPFN